MQDFSSVCGFLPFKTLKKKNNQPKKSVSSNRTTISYQI